MFQKLCAVGFLLALPVGAVHSLEHRVEELEKHNSPPKPVIRAVVQADGKVHKTDGRPVVQRVNNDGHGLNQIKETMKKSESLFDFVFDGCPTRGAEANSLLDECPGNINSQTTYNACAAKCTSNAGCLGFKIDGCGGSGGDARFSCSGTCTTYCAIDAFVQGGCPTSGSVKFFIKEADEEGTPSLWEGNESFAEGGERSLFSSRAGAVGCYTSHGAQRCCNHPRYSSFRDCTGTCPAHLSPKTHSDGSVALFHWWACGSSCSPTYWTDGGCSCHCRSPTPSPTPSLPTASPTGDSCAQATDLSTVSSPFQGTTANGLNTHGTSCGGSAREKIFFIDVPVGFQLTIGMSTNSYDSRHETRWGGACPGTNVVRCTDDPDTLQHTWTNTQGSSQRAYFIVDAWTTGTGTFTLTWSTPPSACQVTVYEHWAEGITAGTPGLEAAERAWGGSFPTGAMRVLRGAGDHPLGSLSNLTSSVKVEGSCCKAYGYTSADCSGTQGTPIAVTTQPFPGLPAGIVTPATGLASVWGCNDCAQCVKVTEQCP